MNQPSRFAAFATSCTIALLSSISLPTVALAETYTFTSAPSSTAPTFTPNIPNGTQIDNFRYAGDKFIYSLYAFKVTKDGVYSIISTTLNNSGPIDNTSWILHGDFSPSDTSTPTTPIENFIISHYGYSNVSELSAVSLVGGNQYSLLVAYNQAHPGTYPYTVTVTFDGPGCVLINGHICIDPAPPPQSGNAFSNTAPGLVNIARGFGQSVSTRMAQVRAAGNVAGAPEGTDVLAFFPQAQNAGLDAIGSATLSDAQDHALSLWGNAFGSFISNRGDGTSPGFNQSAGGVIVGGDALVLEDLWLGVSLGYARSKIVGDSSSGSASADNYHASLYANWAPGPWFATADLGLTFSQFQTERPAVGATAEGRSHMLDTAIGGALGYEFDLGGMSFAPSASLRYDHIASKGYTETGAGLANLTIQDATHHALRIGIGAEASKLFTLNDDLDLEVSASARWEHDLLDTGYTTTQSISGADYQVSATDPGRDAAVLGIGTSAVFKDNLTLNLSYDAELRARQTNHTIKAGLRFTW